MSIYQLPPIESLSSLTHTSQVEILNHLFEPHKSIHEYLNPLLSKSYSSYIEFIDLCRKEFLKLDPTEDLTKDIISSHPRLGIPRQVLSQHSKNEQKNLQDDSSVGEFIQLNEYYENTFPGLRFVLFVNGRNKLEIKELLLQRIQRKNYSEEVRDALNAMCDIATDRYKKLIAAKL
ncbi:hypothetical protein WICMUC_005804 [Wickerhamomyces mucosus]|uniref:Oxo-4-hydroxy-4-carboxy-5-ureidoimidazoline decarboxylase domain-containing protein n=1 Tax=Wickerhamomyces mucosus TaxID=1378264 RepID=A0A9P8P3M1_9ASCO|nr:hypothetical protein WICMUC_005804 [Wickerhamomyces mucosus]